MSGTYRLSRAAWKTDLSLERGEGTIQVVAALAFHVQKQDVRSQIIWPSPLTLETRSWKASSWSYLGTPRWCVVWLCLVAVIMCSQSVPSPNICVVGEIQGGSLVLIVFGKIGISFVRHISIFLACTAMDTIPTTLMASFVILRETMEWVGENYMPDLARAHGTT